MNQYKKLFVFVALTLASCQSAISIPSSVENVSSNFTNSSSSLSSASVVNEQNVIYGFHERHTLDISYSSQLNEDATAILLIHGGSWIGGDKSSMLKYRQSVIENGYVYIAMNYRLISNQSTYLDMLEDLDLAIRYIKNQTTNMPIDMNQIVLLGESAGAHLAMLYSYRNTSPIPIQFLLALVPPVDFTDPNYINFGNPTNQLFLANQLMQTTVTSPNELIENGYPQSWLDASPIHHLDGAIPTLMAYGAFDELIPQSNYERFLAKVDELEAPIEAIRFPNSGHALDNDPLILNDLFSLFYQRIANDNTSIISFDN